jgi:C1A family cysteine protease
MHKLGGCFFLSDHSKPHQQAAKSRDAGVKLFTKSGNLVKLAAASGTGQYLIPEYTPISDQGQLGSCVANGTADAFEIIRGIADPNNVTQLSRLFVYWNARLYDHDTAHDDGTYVSNAMQSLVDYGICEESSWAYDESKVFTQPGLTAYKEADDNTLKAADFYKIITSGQGRLSDIETAVRANHPVVFGTNVGQDLENYDGDPNTVLFAPKTSLGGHCMVVVGVRRNPNLEFYIRNSWSSSWGIGGHVWFDGSYLADSMTNDLYVPTLMPDLLK